MASLVFRLGDGTVRLVRIVCRRSWRSAFVLVVGFWGQALVCACVPIWFRRIALGNVCCCLLLVTERRLTAQRAILSDLFQLFLKPFDFAPLSVEDRQVKRDPVQRAV